jgi:hypothetical protein
MGLTLSLFSLDAKTARELALGPEYVPSPEGEELLYCELGKDWHILHFLFTGTAEATDHPLGLLYDAGLEPEDFCSDDLWIVSSAQVSTFREALRTISDEELKSRFDPEATAAADVYQAHGLTADDWDFVSEGIPRLRDFAEACADRGCGAIILILT